MHFRLICLALATFLSTSILAAPTSEIFSRDSPQPYSCKTINPKVPERKKAILEAGGNATGKRPRVLRSGHVIEDDRADSVPSSDIAISIQET